MPKALLTLFLFAAVVYAQNNATDTNSTDNNASKKKDVLLDKHIQEAIEKEKKYEKEQKFYMGEDYNLSQDEVDPKSVEKVPLIEPEYDFDISDLYDDK